MECWELVNAEGNIISSNHLRGDKVPDGLYHHVVNVLVQHQDGSILIMQRDWQKSILPGKFEASAGGSVLQGETIEAGAKRELLEETGIQAENLIQVRRYLDKTYPVIWTDYYTCVDVIKEQITLQAGETIAFEWVSLANFLNQLKQGNIIYMDSSSLKTYYLELLENN